MRTVNKFDSDFLLSQQYAIRKLEGQVLSYQMDHNDQIEQAHRPLQSNRAYKQVKNKEKKIKDDKYDETRHKLQSGEAITKQEIEEMNQLGREKCSNRIEEERFVQGFMRHLDRRE